jgi:hypothetical protein
VISATKMFIIDFDYLKGRNGEIVVKELAIVGIVKEQVNINQSYLFLPPYPETDLSEEIRCENNGLIQQTHSIPWCAGHTEYSKLREILTNIFATYFSHTGKEDFMIFAKGNQKVMFLSTLLVCIVNDLDAEGCPKARNLQLPRAMVCMFSHKNVHCALHNCNKYAEWLRHYIRKQAYLDIQEWPHETVFRPGQLFIRRPVMVSDWAAKIANCDCSDGKYVSRVTTNGNKNNCVNGGCGDNVIIVDSNGNDSDNSG